MLLPQTTGPDLRLRGGLGGDARLLGDFTEEVPTRTAQDALVVVLRLLCALTGVNPAREIEYENPDTGALTSQEAVSRHRDWLVTECPGNAFADVFDSAIRERVVRGRA